MRQNPDRQDTGQARRTEWRVRPARPSDRAFILGITPRLAQGFELPAWRTARKVVEAESATLENALRPGTERAILLVAEDTEGNVFANNQRARSVYERLGYAPETLHYVKPLT
jgi:hypothetical protein